MAILDIESLLEPVSDEQPCGPNLEYDEAYSAFERASRGKSEQQYGETIIPAEPPDWREVRQIGSELVTRTKDLRVACMLARALLETDGLADFAPAVGLVRGYLERYWSTVHPQLDPEDGNDPTLRVNTVSALSDQSTTVRSLRAVPLVEARGLGRFSLHDLEVATGEIPPAPNEEAPKMSAIEAAFAQCDLDELKANVEAVRACSGHVEAIDAVVTRAVGSSRAVALDDLRETLKELEQILSTKLADRDAAELDGVAPEDVADDESEVGAAANHPATMARATGEIRSREDVVATLDRICQYYNRYEPSSPLPLLLRRAKRLVTKNFLEIIKDLSPDSASQIERLGGEKDDDAEE